MTVPPDLTRDDRPYPHLDDDELYEATMRAARRGDVSLAETLYVAMVDRGAPYSRQRNVINTIWPSAPWPRRAGRGGRR